jgi:hypothetical protein
MEFFERMIGLGDRVIDSMEEKGLFDRRHTVEWKEMVPGYYFAEARHNQRQNLDDGANSVLRYALATTFELGLKYLYVPGCLFSSEVAGFLLKFGRKRTSVQNGYEIEEGVE